MTDLVEQIVGTLMEHQFHFVSEQELQEGIWEALVGHGIEVQREVVLPDKAGRIDFMVAAIGIEVKVDGSLSALIRQSIRYARCPWVDELVVVTTKAKHINMPPELNGKPVTVAHLNRSAF